MKMQTYSCENPWCKGSPVDIIASSADRAAMQFAELYFKSNRLATVRVNDGLDYECKLTRDGWMITSVSSKYLDSLKLFKCNDEQVKAYNEISAVLKYSKQLENGMHTVTTDKHVHTVRMTDGRACIMDSKRIKPVKTEPYYD